MKQRNKTKKGMPMKTKVKISYVGKKVFIGIDVHRLSYAVTAVCEQVVVLKCSVPGEPHKMVQFIANKFPGAEVSSAYEAGFSGLVLHRALTAAGVSNLVVNAASIEMRVNDKVKTDKRDSLKIAIHLSQGRLEGIRIVSEEEELTRLIARTRDQLVKSRGMLMNSVRMKLLQFGKLPIEYRKVLHLKSVEAWTAEKDFPGLLKIAIRYLVECWKSINIQLKAIKQELRLQAKSDPREAIYRSVPGIGPISARVLSNELGDMKQFRNERRLFSFSGMTPSEHSTGEPKNQRRGHITHQGSARIRKILTEAAWVAIKRDPALRAVHQRISVKSGAKKAIVAVARKLLGRIRSLFMKGEFYVNGKGLPPSAA